MQKFNEKITNITNIIRKFFEKIFEYIKYQGGTPYFFFVILGVVLFFLVSSIIILIYYLSQPHIIFSATGLSSKNGYYIFLVGIFFQTLIVFLAYQFTNYIRYSYFGTEKKKTIGLYLIGMITFLTIPGNGSLICSFYAYQKGSETFANHGLLGTFRRILNDNEREKLIQETVKNFFEKIEVSKDIQEQLKIGVSENSQNFHKKYEEGSFAATKYVSDQLETQKEFLQREAVKKFELEILVEKTDKDPQGGLPGISDQAKKGLSYFDPSVTDSDLCAIAGLSLILVTSITILVILSKTTPSTPPDFGNIPPQAPEMTPLGSLKHEVIQMEDILERVLTFGNTDNGNVPINTQLGAEMLATQDRIRNILESIANPRGIIVPDGIPAIRLSREKKAELIGNILIDYQNDNSATANIALEIVQNLITNS